MLEAILHAASLAAFGQSMREGHLEDLVKGLSERSPFSSMESHGFIRASKAYGGGSIASLPGQWLRRLAKEELVAIRLSIPVLNAALARTIPNGERTSPNIVTEGGAGIEVWTPEWTLKSRSADGEKWAVEYVATRGTRQWNAGDAPAKATEDRLFESVQRLCEAFETSGNSQWAKRVGSLHAMRAQRWSSGERYGDALPADWPPAERQLFGNCVRTWIMVNSAEFQALQLDEAEVAALQKVWDSIRAAIETSVNLPARQAGQRAA